MYVSRLAVGGADWIVYQTLSAAANASRASSSRAPVRRPSRIAIPNTTIVPSSTKAYEIVRRARVDAIPRLAWVLDHVPHSTHGRDELFLTTAVHLLSQVV